MALKEIYFRDPTDPKYNSKKLETSSNLESVLNKIRMLLYTNRGEVLGEPDLGMDLEDYLFQFGFDESELRNRFNSQINQYVPEARDFKISIDMDVETDSVQNHVYIYINIALQWGTPVRTPVSGCRSVCDHSMK